MRSLGNQFGVAFWTLMDQGIVSLGNFLVSLLLARALPVSEYGVFALLVSLLYAFQHCIIALLVYPMTIQIAAVSDRARELVPVTMAVTTGSNLAFTLILSLMTAVAGRGDIALEVFAFGSVWLTQDALRRSLMAEFRHSTAAIGDALTYLGQACGVALLAKSGLLTLRSAFMVMAVASLVGGLLQVWQLRLTRPDLTGVAQLLRDYWQSGRWALGSGLLVHMRAQVLLWVLALSNGPAATGLFQAVLNVTNPLNPLLFSACNMISVSSAQALEANGPTAAWTAARYYIALTAPIVFVYGVVVIWIPDIVLHLFYGSHETYLAHAPTLRIVMLALVVSYFTDTYSAYLYGVNQGRSALRIAVVGLVTALLMAGLIVIFGVFGAALALLTANCARLLAAWHTRLDFTSTSGSSKTRKVGATPDKTGARGDA